MIALVVVVWSKSIIKHTKTRQTEHRNRVTATTFFPASCYLLWSSPVLRVVVKSNPAKDVVAHCPELTIVEQHHRVIASASDLFYLLAVECSDLCRHCAIHRVTDAQLTTDHPSQALMRLRGLSGRDNQDDE